jgi:hypothetical protein
MLNDGSGPIMYNGSNGYTEEDFDNNFLITEDDNQLITEDGNILIVEQDVEC